MSGTERNVYVDGQWYGPDYPDNGPPPADKVDGKFLGRKAPEQLDDGDFVGMKAVTEPGEAAQFGAPVPVLDVDESREGQPDIEPVGIKAVQTAEEAAAFRGRPTRRSAAADTPPASEKDGQDKEVKPDHSPSGTPRRASK
jgi:hypothetical protein